MTVGQVSLYKPVTADTETENRCANCGLFFLAGEDMCDYDYLRDRPMQHGNLIHMNRVTPLFTPSLCEKRLIAEVKKLNERSQS